MHKTRLWSLTKRAKALVIPLVCSVHSITATASDEQIRRSGDVLQVLIPAVAYGLTFYENDPDGRYPFYQSFATSLLVTHGLKATVDAQRPNGGQHSFPSGHSSAAFQGASFIHARYGLNYSLPAYLGAAYVGFSRIEVKAHYTRDVLAGAAIGIASSFYFTDPHQRNQKFSVAPVMIPGFQGVAVNAKW